MFFHSEQKKDLSIDGILSDKLNLLRVEVAERFGDAGLDAGFVEKLYGRLLDIHKDDKVFSSEKLYREVVNVKNALAQGAVSFTPDLSTPESQLLWGAAMAHISQNPQVMQNWKSKYRAEKLSLTPLWQSVSNSPEALRVIKNHSFMIAGSFKNRETKIVWSEPNTGYPNVGYCFIPEQNAILDDLLWSLIVGLENSKAALMHEVGHSQGSTEFPEKVKKLREELEPLYKAITEQNWQGKEEERTEKIVEFNKKKNEFDFLFMFYDEMENNYANAYVVRQKGQDYNHQINIVESCICGAGSKYLKTTQQEKVWDGETLANDGEPSEKDVVTAAVSEAGEEENQQGFPAVPEVKGQISEPTNAQEPENAFLKQFINLKRTVRNSFFKNNEFFEDTPDGWKKVGVDLQQLDGFDANGNRLSSEEAFKDLMEQCQKLEKLQVSRRDQLFGRDYYNRRVTEYCRQRNEIIEQVYDRYVGPFLEQEIQKMADQIREEQKQQSTQAQNSQQQNQNDSQANTQNQQIDQQLQQQVSKMIERAKQDQKREIGQKQPQMPSMNPQQSQPEQSEQQQNQQSQNQSGQSQGQQQGQSEQQGESGQSQGQNDGQQQGQMGQDGTDLDHKSAGQQKSAQNAGETKQEKTEDGAEEKSADSGAEQEKSSSGGEMEKNDLQQDNAGQKKGESDETSGKEQSSEPNAGEDKSAGASSKSSHDQAENRDGIEGERKNESGAGNNGREEIKSQEEDEGEGNEGKKANEQEESQKSKSSAADSDSQEETADGEDNTSVSSDGGLKKYDFDNQSKENQAKSASKQEQKKEKKEPEDLSARNEDKPRKENDDHQAEKQGDDRKSLPNNEGSKSVPMEDKGQTADSDNDNPNSTDEKSKGETSAQQKDVTKGDNRSSHDGKQQPEEKNADGQNAAEGTDKNPEGEFENEKDNKSKKTGLENGEETGVQNSEKEKNAENSAEKPMPQQNSQNGFSKEQMQQLLENARMLEELAREYEEEQERGDNDEKPADQKRSWSDEAKIDINSLQNLAKRDIGGGSANGEASFKREGNIEAYKQMVGPFGSVIAQTREMFKKIKEKQKKQLEEISRKMNLLPEDNDVTRFSVDAHKRLLDKMQCGSGLSVKDFERFRTENKKKNVSATIDVAVLIDGSGSMDGAPFHNALVAGCIIFEAAKNIKDVNIYMYMMGNPRPLCIAKPEFSIEEVSKNLERVREGQGSDRDHIMPAIEKFLEDLEKHEQGASQSENVGASHIFAITDGYNTDRDPEETNEKIKQLVLGSKYISLDYLFIDSGYWGDVYARDIIDELSSNKGTKRIGETAKISQMKQIPPLLLNLLKNRLKETDLTQTPKRYEKNKLTKKILNKWNEGRY